MHVPLSACLMVLDLSPLKAKRVLLWREDMFSHLLFAVSLWASVVFSSFCLMAVRCSSTISGSLEAPLVPISVLYTFRHWSWYLSKCSSGSGVFLAVGANLRPRLSTSLSVSVRGCLERLRISGILLVSGLLGVISSFDWVGTYFGQCL